MITAHRLTILKIMSYTTLALATLLLGYIIIWLFFPYKPIDFKTSFVVSTPVVEQGGEMIYTFDYCKRSSIIPTVKREFVDGIVFRSSNARANVTLGCHTITQHEQIPDTLPPGNYHFRVTVDYQMNPLRHIQYINETNTFKVIASKDTDRD